MSIRPVFCNLKFLVVTAAVFAFGAAQASAAVGDVPDVGVVCTVLGGVDSTWQLSPSGQSNGDGTYSFDGSWGNAMVSMDWNMLVDPDPQISSGFSVTNNTPVTQTYSITVTLPIAPPLPGATLMGGSFQGGITDNNTDGVLGTVGTNGVAPMYYGMIDGVGVLPLHSDPFSVTVPFLGGSNNIPSVSAGLPGPTLAGPAALATIGIQHIFTLTPGDTATLSGFFIVVPEPASLMILGLGGLLMIRKRR